MERRKATEKKRDNDKKENKQEDKKKKDSKIKGASNTGQLKKNVAEKKEKGSSKKPTQPVTYSDSEDTEEMSKSRPTDPKERAKSRPYSPWSRKEAAKKTKVEQTSQTSGTKKKSTQKFDSQKHPPPREGTKSAETEEEEESAPTPVVKQFSFPQYKILSGASIAPVKMVPQNIVIQSARLREQDQKHWAWGLFQPSKMSLQLRVLRLFMIWVFFRVLNKQTSWLSGMLGLGHPEPEMRPPPRRTPGERFIKMFHPAMPHPMYVRVPPP